MAEQEPRASQESGRSLPLVVRRSSRAKVAPIVTRLAVASAGLFILACTAWESKPLTQAPSPQAGSRPPLPGQGPRWRDEALKPGSDSVIKSVTFYFDPGRNNATALELCFTGNPGEFRIISRQMNQVANSGPGYLYNRPHDAPRQATCETFSAVTRVEPNEIDQINIGERRYHEPYDKTYTGRAYRTTRPGDAKTIEVEYLGIQALDPDTVIPRSPNEPSHYFKR